MNRHFWAQVEKTQGCWLWKGAVNAQGRGTYEGGTARRFAFAEANGPVPPRLHVHANFDCSPRCVRPDHLHTTAHSKTALAPPTQHFWTFVDKSGGPEACWLWTGTINKTKALLPYGMFSARVAGKTKTWLAHRFAWEQAHGPIPPGTMIRHVVCRNPRCVNALHMAAGTGRDNHDDAVRDGTVAYQRDARTGQSRRARAWRLPSAV